MYWTDLFTSLTRCGRKRGRDKTNGFYSRQLLFPVGWRSSSNNNKWKATQTEAVSTLHLLQSQTKYSISISRPFSSNQCRECLRSISHRSIRLADPLFRLVTGESANESRGPSSLISGTYLTKKAKKALLMSLQWDHFFPFIISQWTV